VWHLRHANPNQKRINPRLGKAKDNSTKYPTKGEKSQKVGYRADASECSHNNVRSRLTPRISDPAPMTPSLQPKRNRGVRCIRFLDRAAALDRGAGRPRGVQGL